MTKYPSRSINEAVCSLPVIGEWRSVMNRFSWPPQSSWFYDTCGHLRGSAGVLCRYPSDFLLCLREKKEKREEEEKRKREKKKKKIHKYKSQLSSSLPLSTYSALCFSPHLSTSSLAHIVLSHELVEFIYFLRMYECWRCKMYAWCMNLIPFAVQSRAAGIG